jgi:hypothetical protein
VAHAAGMMMGNLVFGLIKDSIVITRVKKEKKEIENKRAQMLETLQKRKSTVMFMPGGNTMASLETERDAINKK